VSDVSLAGHTALTFPWVPELSAWFARGSKELPWQGMGMRRVMHRLEMPGLYAALWSEDAHGEEVRLAELPPPEHLARCRELAERDYRPVALGVSDLAGVGERGVSVWRRPRLSGDGSDRGAVSLAARQANAAATLARLDEPGPAWELLRHRPNPQVRSYLIEQLAARGVEAKQVLERLKVEKDPSARRALILALGEYGDDQLSAPEREEWGRTLLDWYRRDPDAGLHGALDWLLRHGKEGPAARALDWGQAAALDAVAEPPGLRTSGPTWWVSPQGQTFTLIPGPVEFAMGSPADEPGRYGGVESLHRRRIGRSFALAAKLVTVRQFQEFLKRNPEVKHNYLEAYSPDPDGPILSVTWFEAAQYCRWLSEQEGIPEDQMCYPPVAEIEACKTGPRALVLPADCLHRSGYRLPTEAEWEYGCRAGADTRYFCGSEEGTLSRYAWYVHNSRDRTWPVGQKRPNDLGLFDTHGNAWQWCHEIWLAAPMPDPDSIVEDREQGVLWAAQGSRPLRGGSFSDLPRNARCAVRFERFASQRIVSHGLRLARTLPP
jgi:formylglycine-generating enzyme required for sulfatase activity